MRHFIIGILVTIFVFIVGPIIFEKINWISGLREHGVLILSVTGIGLVFKLFFSRIATGDFTYEKYSFDNCVVTFGGALTAFVFQLSSQEDHFPGIASTPLQLISISSNSNLGNRQLQLFVFVLIVLIFTLLTALICREIKEDKIKNKDITRLGSMLMGVLVLGTYVLILVLKK